MPIPSCQQPSLLHFRSLFANDGANDRDGALHPSVLCATWSRLRDDDVDDRILGANAVRQYIYLYAWFFDRIYRANLRLTPRRDEYCASKEKSFSFVIIMRCAFTTAETATMQWNM